MPDLDNGPISQEVAQAAQVPLQVSPEGPVNAQPPMQSGSVQNAGQPVAPSVSDAMQGGQQPSLPASVTQAPQTTQPEYKESWQHKLGGVLAGGTHNATYKVDPETGKIGVELKPKSAKEELLGSVANILSGLAAGAGQKNFYKGFSAGAQQVSQQLQQRQGQQKQDAIDNYNQQQQAKVLKAQAMHANLQAYSLAQDIGRKDKEDHDTMVSTYADSVKDLRELNIPGADQELSEDDVKKLNGTDKVAMAVGTVPRIDPATGKQAKINGVPQWDNTYIAVPKDARVPVTDEEGKPKDWVSQAQSWGIMPDKKVAPQDLRVGTAASIMHSVAALNSFSTELNNFATKMNVPPTDLKAALKADPALKGALQKFQLTAGMSTQPDIQVDALRQKDPDAAAKIANLFGPDNLEKYKNQRIDEAAAGKTAAETTARANAEDNTPIGQQKLTNEKLAGQEKQLQIQKLLKDLTSPDLSEIVGKTVPHPDNGGGITSDRNVYPVNDSALDQLQQSSPGLAASIQAVGEYREGLTPQAQRTKDGQTFMGLVNQVYPRYNAPKYESYLKTRTDQKLQQQINILSTAMEHLGTYHSALGPISGTPYLSGVERALGSQDAKDVQTSKQAASDEFAKLYKGGVADKKEKEDWDNSLGGATYLEKQSGVKSNAKLLKGKINAFVTQYRNSAPPGMKDDTLQLISPEAAQAYKDITGEDISSAIHPLSKGPYPQNSSPQVRPVIVNGQIVGHTSDGKTMTPVSQ